MALKTGRNLALASTPSPRPSGERAGTRGFEPENNRPPHPPPSAVLLRRTGAPLLLGEEREKKWQRRVALHPAHLSGFGLARAKNTANSEGRILCHCSKSK